MSRALTFEVSGHLLLLPGDGRREVFERGAVVPLPGGGPLLLGLTALHGRAVPLVTVAPLLGAAPAAGTLTLLAEEAGEELALAVDALGGLTEGPRTEGLPFADRTDPLGEAPAPGEPRPLNLPALVRLLRAGLAPAP